MNITKTVKRFFQILLFLVVLLVGLAFAIPYFFKDEIVQRVKEDINKNFNATIDFKDVSLSLFRSFPNFSFGLDQFSIIGKDEFEGIPLTTADNIRFTLDLMSVIQKERPIEVQEVQLEKPVINLVILRNGKSNYDIVKPSENAATNSESESYNFLIQLQKYGINNGDFTYDDRSSDIFVHLVDIDHSGKGDFTQDVFDLVTQTQIGQMTVGMGGINYLNKTAGDFDVTLTANLPQQTYTLKDNNLRLNDLQIKADGQVQTDWTEYKVAIDFSAPQNNFKNFLSLIPNAYTKDYAAVKATGNLQLRGKVNGTYNGEKNQYPAFQIQLDIDKGSFQYPDLPMGISDIIAKATINSPSSNFDQMTIDVPQMSMNLGNNPFQAQFLLKTPVSDPDINTTIKGKIDLSQLAQAFPMAGVDNLSGLIDADLKAKARLSDMDRQDYEEVDVKGDLQITDLSYITSDMPAVKIKTMDLNFTPKQVNVNEMEMQLGKSDLRGKGTIDNILAYFSPAKTMKGQMDLQSNFFDSNEWLEEDASTSQTPTVVDSEQPATEIFDRFDFDINARVDRLLYDVYEITQSTLKGRLTPSTATIDNFKLKLGASDLSGSGQLTNVFNYIFKDETLGGQLALQSNFFDLNPFMEEDNTTGNAKKIADEAVEPFLVPEKIDIKIDAKVAKVLYTDLTINDLQGELKIKDEAISFDNCTGKTLGGTLKINGAYDTVNPEKPGFNLEYAIQQFDFQQSFKQFNTFAKLAPIAEYIQGKFNSTMSFSGTLGKDMMPILDNVNADGFLQTINSIVRGVEPLEKIGNQLNIDLFKKLEIKDTKNWFDIKNGKVTIKDFELKQQGIDMIIGGSHSFTQDMDYKIQAKIPRSLLEKGAVGNLTEKGIGFLKKEAGKYNVNIDVGEFINVLINLTGSIKDPKVSFKVLGSGGEKSLVEQAKEEIKQVVDEKVAEVRDTVTKVVTEKKEDLKKKMDAEIKSIMDVAEKQAATIRSAGKKAAEEARKQGYAQADNLITQAGSNPFKKKVAETAANELRKKTDKEVDKINQEADKKAEDVLNIARKKVEDVKKSYADK